MAALSRQILEQALERSSHALLILDARRGALPVAYANRSAAASCAATAQAMTGKPWPPLEASEEAQAAVRGVLESGEPAEVGMAVADLDENAHEVRINVAPLWGTGGRCEYLLIEVVDIPEEAVDSLSVRLLEQQLGDAREALRKLQKTDPRSGLLRFEPFREILTRDLAIARRESKPLSILTFEILDLDVYRDTFGPNAVDTCVRMLAKQVDNCLRRATDLCAQLDASTIVASLLGQDAQAASALGERICRNIERLRLHNPRAQSGRFVSVAMTAHEANPESEGIDALLERVVPERTGAAAEHGA